MTSTRCPCCGESTQFLHASTVVAYCDICGWNVASARERLALRRRAMYSVLVFYALVISAQIAFTHDPGVEVCFLIGTLALAGIIAYRLGSKDSRRLAGVYQRVKGDPVRRTVPTKPDAAALAQLEEARALARPRPVQRNRFARSNRKPLIIACIISFTIIPLFWGIDYLIFLDHAIRPRDARAAAIYILANAAVLWLLSRRAYENKRALNLLRNGEAALGRVVSPLVGSFPTPGITYEFRDAKGTLVFGAAADIHGTIEEDAHILVFYDAQRPENSVALCGTDYELAEQLTRQLLARHFGVGNG